MRCRVWVGRSPFVSGTDPPGGAMDAVALFRDVNAAQYGPNSRGARPAALASA